MKALARVRAVGGSLMVRIPKEVAEAEQIRKDAVVQIEIFPFKKSFFGVARGVGPFTKEDELDSHD